MKNRSLYHLERDFLILSISIVATVALEYYGVFDAIFGALAGSAILASFFAGIFFTSLFTITPAAAALAELSNYAPFLSVGLAGAAGAVLGDLILFFFVRDTVSADLSFVVNRSWKRWLARTFHHPLLQWLVPVIGAIIIASPLPDELGLVLMGLSKTRLIVLIPISFAMNFLGVALIWLAANAV